MFNSDFDPNAFGKLYRNLSDEEKKSFVASLSDEEAFLFSNLWQVRAREKQIPTDGDWFVYLYCTGRGFGKELDIETPIPTSSGWVKMGDILVGDEVFDEKGKVCKVVEIFPIEIPEVAYRVHFSDGSFIDACSEHQWVTWEHTDRKQYLRKNNPKSFPDDWVNWKEKRRRTDRNSESYFGPKIRVTQEIADTLTYNRRGDLNHCIPQCLPLELPEIDLPIPPYLYGLWLADGHSDSAYISKNRNDLNFLRERIEKEGFETRDTNDPIKFHIVGLRKLLRENGLLKNKQVLSVYLRASFDQRLALLQGLLDGDGYVGTNNYCEFSNTNPSIANAVYELLVSMGIRVTRSKKIPTLNGKPCTETEILKFIPTLEVFSLPRKKNRLRFDRGQPIRRYHRMITKVEHIESKPMRCITVDSPNNMYLAGEAMIPTHNTLSLTGWADTKARAFSGCRMAFVAPTAADARDVLVQGDSGVQAVAPKWDVPRYSPTYRRVEWSNGSRAWLYSAEESERLRGPQHHYGIGDEIRAWADPETWDNLIFGMRLGDKPQIVGATTPKPSALVKMLLEDKTIPKVFGSTLENAANLAKPFLDKILEKYAGTRLGDQEIEGILLEDLVGALWKSWMFDLLEFRVNDSTLPLLNRKCVSIDPAVSTNKNSNETGMVVCGVENRKLEGRQKPLKHFYLIEDLSQSTAPHMWAQAAVDAYYRHECDFIVAEGNNGGNLVSEIISTIDSNIEVKIVKATVGKEARAEPIAAFYSQGRAHHYDPEGKSQTLKEVEDQMLNWIPGSGTSPDRIDATVWGGHALMLDEQDEAPIMRRAVARHKVVPNWNLRR